MGLLARIISGGQTAADRGALDAAIEFGMKHGKGMRKILRESINHGTLGKEPDG